MLKVPAVFSCGSRTSPGMPWLAKQLLFCGDGAPILKLQMEQASPSRGKGRGQGTVKRPQLEILEEPVGSTPRARESYLTVGL